MKRTDRRIGKFLAYASVSLWLIYALLLLSPWDILALKLSSLFITGMIAGYISWCGAKMMEAITLDEGDLRAESTAPPGTGGVKGYADPMYYLRECPESASFKKKALRPGDMGAALCYAFGVRNYSEVVQLLEIGEETACSVLGFEQQMARVSAGATRYPKKVLSVGSGRGELEAAFVRMGVECICVDPSPFVKTYLPNVISSWGRSNRFSLVNKTFGESVSDFSEKGIDTAIFCESLEHIPEDDFDAGWKALREELRRNSGILIIVNWISFHPIFPDATGWDHVRRVDEKLYDRLASEARNVIFRQGSHLVLQF